MAELFWPNRLKRILHILCCPECKGSLSLCSNGLCCTKCNSEFLLIKNKLYFIKVPEVIDDLDSLKYKLKHVLGKYYYSIGVDIIAPTFPFNFKKAIDKFIGFADNKIIVDVGCGDRKVSEEIIGIDIFPYAATDIICDLSSLPFANQSIDAFVSRSVLEHVNPLSNVIEEFNRCAKPYAKMLHIIPFLYPYHASPYDFQRLTHTGAKALFENWTLVHQKNITGPITLLLLLLIEIISLLFSFGNKRIQSVIYLICCLILFPLKFIDGFFIKTNLFITIAPSIMTVLKKNEA